MCTETKALAKKWPRAGNPAFTYGPTGALASSITSKVKSGRNPSGVVGSALDYALVVHNGGKARVIKTRTKKFMKFRWKRMGGQFAYFKTVRHPATKGSYFLTGPLRIVAARNGFIVRKTGPL